MVTPLTLGQPAEIDCPDSDGQPMSDNTLQFQWIVTLQSNLDILFKDDANVFVAGDLLWYPVEGHPEVRAAPDALVAFGRPKGYRGSYRQWQEGGIAPQVVFEVLSPGNRPDEMALKLQFYDTYGVEEYYLYDPDSGALSGWRRVGPSLQPLLGLHNEVSPRLKIRFDLSGPELVIYDPKGQKFLTSLEREAQREQERQQREKAEQQTRAAQERTEQERRQREKAEQQARAAQERTEQERRQREKAEQQARAAQERADQERRQREKAEQQVKDEQHQRQQAEQQAGQATREAKQARQQTEQERSKREQAEERTRQLADRLRELGIDPDAPSGPAAEA